MRDDKIRDEFARAATGALGALSGLKDEAEQRARRLFEEVLNRMDLVRREEFDAVRAIAVKAREEQEKLAERLAALEARTATPPADEANASEDAESPSEGEPV